MKRKLLLTVRASVLPLFFILILISSEDILAKGMNNNDVLNNINMGSLQQVTIRGIVTDNNGETLPGVSVIVKGTNIGTSTGLDGTYSLSATVGSGKLVFSYLGFNTMEQNFSDTRSVVNVVLTESSQALSEVVVTGYTTEQKKDIIGSVAVVNTDDLLSTPAGNITTQLQGRAAGVTVSSDGTPGGAAKVRIRGFGSFGGSDPLYVIDGVPASSSAIDNLNPNDIESLQILKDAAAASVYGARAANGVVIVSTKKGKSGEPRISVDSYYGVNYVSSKDFPDLLNTKEMSELYWASIKGSGQVPAHAQYGDSTIPIIPEYIKAGSLGGAALEQLRISDPVAFAAAVDPANYDFQTYQIIKSANTDWFDEVFNPAPIKNIQLSASGGSDKGTYSVSLNYFSQDNTSNKYGFFDRYTTRANSSFNIKNNIRIGENLQVTYSNSRTGGGSGAAWQMQSIIPVYDIMGNPAGGAAPSTGNARNPITENWRNRFDKNNGFGVFGNVYAEATVLKDFVARTSIGVDYGTTNNWDVGMRTYEHAENTAVSSLNRNTDWNTSWTWTNTLTYNKAILDHSIKVLLGSESIRTYTDNLVGTVQDFDIIDDPDFVTLNTGVGAKNTTGTFGRQSLSSLFARLDYSFSDKYLVNATIRRDGSSKFGSNNRYGTFPAIGLGWRISQEDFMKGISWLNDLKLRGSYGVIGNQNGLAPQNQYSLYLKRPRDGYALNGGNSVIPGFSVSNLGNPYARWERNITTNIGLDATLFNNKLEVNFEYFVKNTDDLLVQNQAPQTGSTAVQPAVNVGNMRNKGIDLSITKRGNTLGGLTYEASVNISGYKNKVLNVLESDDSFLSGANAAGLGIISRTEAGYPVSYIWGYQVDGFFETQQEVDDYIAAGYTSWITPQLGRWRIKDINDDKKIDETDRTQIGSPHPDFQVGFNLSLAYKNFDLSGFVFWNQGGQVFNLSRRNTDFNRFVLNRSARMLYQSWTPGADNSNALLPKLDASDSQSPSQASDYFVEDVTYIRLKNLQLGYTFPSNVFSRVGIDRLRVYVQGQNLFTAVGGKKPFTGLDPGSALSGTDISMGAIDNQNPTPKQFLFGLNLSF